MNSKKARFIPVQVYRKIFEKKIKNSQMSVLFALFTYGADGNNIFPSIGRIAHDVNLSESQIKRIFKDLENDKILIRTGKTTFGTVIYKIDIEKLPYKESYIGKKQQGQFYNELKQSEENEWNLGFENDTANCSSF